MTKPEVFLGIYGVMARYMRRLGLSTNVQSEMETIYIQKTSGLLLRDLKVK
jgi:hypothetical protein